jgi:hypothetical protein
MKLTHYIVDLGRAVAYYPNLKKVTGSTTASILLCQLLYWSDKSEDGWIYKNSYDIEEETGLTYFEQRTARKKLVKEGLITEREDFLMHRIGFMVCQDALNQKWEKHGGKQLKPIKKEKSQEETKRGRKPRKISEAQIPLPEIEEENKVIYKPTEEQIAQGRIDTEKAIEEIRKVSIKPNKLVEETSIEEAKRDLVNAAVEEINKVSSKTKKPIEETTTERTNKKEIKKDWVDASIEYDQSPWKKKQDAQNLIREKLSTRLNIHINPSNVKWENFIKFVYDREVNYNEPVDKFIDWALENNFNPIYWTPEKMELSYPSAFPKKSAKVPIGNFVKPLPKVEEPKQYAPMPDELRKKKNLY